MSMKEVPTRGNSASKNQSPRIDTAEDISWVVSLLRFFEINIAHEVMKRELRLESGLTTQKKE